MLPSGDIACLFWVDIRTGLFSLVFRLSFRRWYTYIILPFESKFEALLCVLGGIAGLWLLCMLSQSVWVVLCVLLPLCDVCSQYRATGGWFLGCSALRRFNFIHISLIIITL